MTIWNQDDCIAVKVDYYVHIHVICAIHMHCICACTHCTYICAMHICLYRSFLVFQNDAWDMLFERISASGVTSIFPDSFNFFNENIS